MDAKIATNFCLTFSSGKNKKLLLRKSFFENYFSNNQYVKKLKKYAEKFLKVHFLGQNAQKNLINGQWLQDRRLQ